MANDDEFLLIKARDSGESSHLHVRLNYSNAYRIWATLKQDAGDWDKFTDFYTITDAPHCIELDFKISSAPAANDGTMELLIDGVSKEIKTGVDNDTKEISSVLFGATDGLDVGTSGTFFLDDFASNNDGSLIGQISDNTIFFGCNF